jgi:hypothetical protein
LKYKIYKKNWVTYHYYLFDSTSSSSYIDTTEDLLNNPDPGGIPPPNNLFYYVVAIDNSRKVSLTTSDTIGYPAYVCPTCLGEIGPDNFIVSSEQKTQLKEYSISNFPNPFNPTTKINYSIPIEGIVKITIYNSPGQTVKELVNEFKSIGSYTTEFNGSSLSSGIYYYKIEAGNFSQIRKMILIK